MTDRTNTALNQLISEFLALNPTHCSDDEIFELQREAASIPNPSPEMAQVIQLFCALNPTQCSDEELASMQALFGKAMERQAGEDGQNPPSQQTPAQQASTQQGATHQASDRQAASLEARKSRRVAELEQELTHARAAKAWMGATAKSLGLGSDDDDVLVLAGALTHWIDTQRRKDYDQNERSEIAQRLSEARDALSQTDIVHDSFGMTCGQMAQSINSGSGPLTPIEHRDASWALRVAYHLLKETDQYSVGKACGRTADGLEARSAEGNTHTPHPDTDHDCPHAAAARNCPCGFCRALTNPSTLSGSGGEESGSEQTRLGRLLGTPGPGREAPAADSHERNSESGDPNAATGQAVQENHRLCWRCVLGLDSKP